MTFQSKIIATSWHPLGLEAVADTAEFSAVISSQQTSLRVKAFRSLTGDSLMLIVDLVGMHSMEGVERILAICVLFYPAMRERCPKIFLIDQIERTSQPTYHWCWI